MCRGSSSLLLFTFIVVLQAEIAQLVEHNLAKVGVAGPSPVFRSNKKYSTSVFLNLSPSGGIGRRARFRCVCFSTCRFESCLGHRYSKWYLNVGEVAELVDALL